MKKFTSKLLIFTVFMLVFVVMAQSAHAMGLLPWRNNSGGESGNRTSPVGVPEPYTLSLLVAGIAGVGGYLLIRNKDK